MFLIYFQRNLRSNPLILKTNVSETVEIFTKKTIVIINKNKFFIALSKKTCANIK